MTELRDACVERDEVVGVKGVLRGLDLHYELVLSSSGVREFFLNRGSENLLRLHPGDLGELARGLEQIHEVYREESARLVNYRLDQEERR